MVYYYLKKQRRLPNNIYCKTYKIPQIWKHKKDTTRKFAICEVHYHQNENRSCYLHYALMPTRIRSKTELTNNSNKKEINLSTLTAPGTWNDSHKVPQH